MSEERENYVYSNQDILDIIDNEGLGYAVYGYLGPKGEFFQDVELGELWDKAAVAMKTLQARLRRVERELGQ